MEGSSTKLFSHGKLKKKTCYVPFLPFPFNSEIRVHSSISCLDLCDLESFKVIHLSFLVSKETDNEELRWSFPRVSRRSLRLLVTMDTANHIDLLPEHQPLTYMLPCVVLPELCINTMPCMLFFCRIFPRWFPSCLLRKGSLSTRVLLSRWVVWYKIRLTYYLWRPNHQS